MTFAAAEVPVVKSPSTEPAAVAAPSVSPAIAANEALGRGNLQMADYLCRAALRQSPRDAVALCLLGHLATSVHRHRLATTYFERALAVHPASQDVRSWFERAREMAQAADARRGAGTAGESRPGKFLLIKAWGYGFWSDMDHVAGQLLLAELTGRTPLVHWGSNSLFGSLGVDNAFEQFFQPVSQATVDDVAASVQSIYPPKWTRETLRAVDVNKTQGPGSRVSCLHLLARDDDLVVNDFHGKVDDLLPWIEPDSDFHGLDYASVYRRIFDKYIRLQPPLAARIDAFQAQRMAGRRWLAVHVRGSDKVAELSDLALVNSLYHQRIEREIQADPAIGIFLLTDSEHFAREYRERYGDRILAADVARTSGIVGVHYGGHGGRKLGEEVVMDTWLAARCDGFLGNGASNVSTAVRHLKAWAPGTFELIGTDFLTVPNTMLHRW